MDENKRLTLGAVKYQVQNVCALCVHAQFPLDDWGTCGLHTYEHKKHNDKKRHLSIHKAGSCDQFIISENQLRQLGAFAELLNYSGSDS